MTITSLKTQIDIPEFTLLIQKLKKLDKFIYLKFDKDFVSSNMYTPQKDSVKQVSIESDKILSVQPEDLIKITFYDADRVLEVLKHFTGKCNSEICFEVLNDELIATEFLISNGKLKINLLCADPALGFIDMSESDVKKAFATSNQFASFEMSSEQIKSVTDLFKLDKTNDIVKIGISPEGVYLKGDNYQTILDETVTGALTEIITYKKYFDMLDRENYNFILTPSRIIAKSLDSTTNLLFANCVE